MEAHRLQEQCSKKNYKYNLYSQHIGNKMNEKEVKVHKGPNEYTKTIEFYSDMDYVLEDEEWKDIEDKPEYAISNYGRVRNHNSVVYRKPFVSNRGYLRVGLSPNRSPHKLVIEQFSNEKPLETVNHKDGNKFNNHISNLEYQTYQENNRHAVDNKLRSFQHEVTVTDLETNEVKNYPSLNRLKEDIDLQPETVLMYAKRSKKQPLLNRYIIDISPTFFHTYNTDKHYVYDYVNDKHLEFDSKIQASYELGINRTSMGMNYKKNPKPYAYIGGYFITKDKDLKPIPMSIDKAIVDRTRIEANTYNRIKRKYYAYDYINKKEYEFDTIRKLCDFIGSDNANAVGSNIARGKTTKITRLVNGYGVKDNSVIDLPWHEYSETDIERSKAGLRVIT